MSTARLRVVSPDRLDDHLRDGPLPQALTDLARCAGVELSIAATGEKGQTSPPHPSRPATPIHYRGKRAGRIEVQRLADGVPSDTLARPLAALMEHMLHRELAVDDLADALLSGYEELNLLYTLLPNIATKVDASEIAEVLVAEATRTLCCNRVSLLVLDERREYYTVLASRGLPPEVRDICVPVSESVAARTLVDEDLLVVNSMAQRPDLAKLSRGQYESDSFAVVRVPLTAHGEALGFFTATERADGGEFSSRDRKLLEGLSAMGASALMNCRLHRAVNKQMVSTIHALASAVDAKDHYTHDHAGRVAKLCIATVRRLGVTDANTLREVELAGLLHDIGKIGIPDAILSKPAKLTPGEYGTIQTHCAIGARIVGHVPGLEHVAKAILCHHERYDGMGYPTGLSGEAIPLASALIATADTFDALTSDRPYRKAGTIDAAMRELNTTKGTQLNPRIVEAFIEVVHEELQRARHIGKGGENILSSRPAFVPS